MASYQTHTKGLGVIAWIARHNKKQITMPSKLARRGLAEANQASKSQHLSEHLSGASRSFSGLFIGNDTVRAHFWLAHRLFRTRLADSNNKDCNDKDCIDDQSSPVGSLERRVPLRCASTDKAGGRPACSFSGPRRLACSENHAGKHEADSAWPFRCGWGS